MTAMLPLHSATVAVSGDATCWAKAALVTAALLVERIDGSLVRHSLTGLIDIDRTAPLPFSYVLRAAYVLEQGSNEWPGMERFIRLAAIYRLTPANGLPLVLSAQWLAAHLPSRTAFHQLPLAMAIYRLFGHLLTHHTHSLALQEIDNRHYWIGDVETFRVVPLGELPGGHRYADGYKRADPAIRSSTYVFPFFSAFLLNSLLSYWCDGEGVGHRRVLRADIGRGDCRYGRLVRTDGITEDLGIVADWGYDRGNLDWVYVGMEKRFVVVSGFRQGETIAAYLLVEFGSIHLYTTERPAANTPASLTVRFSGSMPLWRRLLRPFGLKSDVIDRGTVVGASLHSFTGSVSNRRHVPAQNPSSPSAPPDPQHTPDDGKSSYRLAGSRLCEAELSCVFANWQPCELTRLRPAIGTSLFLHAAANYTHLVIDSTAERPRQMWERMRLPIAHKRGGRAINLRHVGHRADDPNGQRIHDRQRRVGDHEQA
ncbi:unnamed protein product [Vitrella brassicaformis CCMP3155]|uniref:Uncharacterized protein n=1 Tax=Vitrella brassicaformis (strain CCMP3155) TaxID=1169540 RepID=A0A0G4EH94_VITBC|nr:unnamed protein product [Vitrella brassicaformis CCMP3155]|eukprot:CEL95856.1 unnamed protein product [Vitrella brassicaformis CCMP3155]